MVAPWPPVCARWADEVIGGWNVSSIFNQHSGYAWSTVSNAFVPGLLQRRSGLFQRRAQRTTNTPTSTRTPPVQSASSRMALPPQASSAVRSASTSVRATTCVALATSSWTRDSTRSSNLARPRHQPAVPWRLLQRPQSPQLLHPAAPAANTDITNSNFGVIRPQRAQPASVRSQPGWSSNLGRASRRGPHAACRDYRGRPFLLWEMRSHAIQIRVHPLLDLNL